MLLWINLLGRIFFHAALVGCFLRMLNVQKRLIIIWRKFIKAGRFSSRVKVFNVVNKTKGRMSKRVFQESKALQIFWKTNISYPLIRTRTCVSRKESTPNFPKKRTFLNPFCILETPVLRFVLLPYYPRYMGNTVPAMPGSHIEQARRNEKGLASYKRKIRFINKLL